MSTEIKVVIGANFGDEGKGTAVDYFTYQFYKEYKNTVVVLSNGGSQRGHTVTLPSGGRHIFRHFGSGSFFGAYTYLPKYYIVNPMNWAEEHKAMEVVVLGSGRQSCEMGLLLVKWLQKPIMKKQNISDL